MRRKICSTIKWRGGQETLLWNFLWKKIHLKQNTSWKAFHWNRDFMEKKQSHGGVMGNLENLTFMKNVKKSITLQEKLTNDRKDWFKKFVTHKDFQSWPTSHGTSNFSSNPYYWFSYLVCHNKSLVDVYPTSFYSKAFETMWSRNMGVLLVTFLDFSPDWESEETLLSKIKSLTILDRHFFFV